MRLVLIGPPGAGKGTQARFIAAHLGVPKISTGEIFRDNAAAGTSLGAQARPYLDTGRLVPDPIAIGMARDRLSEPDAEAGFVLDGFPRTIPQAEMLDELLATRGTALDLVLELVVDDDEVIRRLSGRRICHNCGRVWHVDFNPPSRGGHCDRCGGELFQRDDDRPDTVARRLRVYLRDTAPLIQFYDAQGKLVGIDATGPVEDVTARAIDTVRFHGG